jgi:hypothetical protein
VSQVRPYDDALARVREVLAFHRRRPDFLTRSLEMEDAVRGAARAALRDGVPVTSALADLGRAVAEAIPEDRPAAVRAAQVMARWAAREYREAAGGVTRERR